MISDYISVSGATVPENKDSIPTMPYTVTPIDQSCSSALVALTCATLPFLPQLIRSCTAASGDTGRTSRPLSVASIVNSCHILLGRGSTAAVDFGRSLGSVASFLVGIGE